MNRLTVRTLPLSGLVIVERQPLGDERGSLTRIFCARELAACGWKKPVAQINSTLTHHRSTVRGLHFQYPPNAEMKLIQCLRGAVWDVAVDIRANSPTFLHWHAEILSPENGHALLIPEGFAHGFQTLSDNVELLYLHSAPYSPQSEGGIHHNDPRMDIQWPLPVSNLSARDQKLLGLPAKFAGVSL